MNKKVASLESQMDARVNEAVQLALSQRGTAGSHPDVVISLAVAALPDIIRLKCAIHHQTTIRVNTHLKRSNPAVLSGKIPIKPLEPGSNKAA